MDTQPDALARSPMWVERSMLASTKACMPESGCRQIRGIDTLFWLLVRPNGVFVPQD